MRDRFRLLPHPIEIDKHPRWVTHYIQLIDIVDTETGRVCQTFEAFDTDGRVAVQNARKLAFAWIAEQNDADESTPSPVPTPLE